MKRIQLLLLCLASGVLLSLGWFPDGWAPFLFVAWVPLLIAEMKVRELPAEYPVGFLFLGTYLCFFSWNLLVTWWIKNASFGGAAMAILTNALLMTIVFMLAHSVNKRTKGKFTALIFISFWIGFEFLHMDWDLSWPWLTLGNALASVPYLIQWYEYTGVFGGSLWVLLVNFLLFALIYNKFKTGRIRSTSIVVVLAAVILPALLSFLVKYRLNEEPGTKLSVVVVQPNIDPYNEKFDGNFEAQLEKILHLASEQVDSSTDYLILPETALTEDLWEGSLEQSYSIHALRQFIEKFPRLSILTGASTAKIFKPGEALSATARQFTNADSYYDAYNTALQIEKDQPIQIYHKSKLVPGVEKMPFPFIFKYLDKFAVDLGGTTGSLGAQEERTPMYNKRLSVATAPVICYESIYGEFVGDYLRNGANFISIITNDGWWGDTPGYKQHLRYGTLRAIESRKWVARSANTGISCFIAPNGSILQATSWWHPSVIKQQIVLTPNETIYTRFGDVIGRLAMYLGLLLLLYSWMIRFRVLKA